MLKIIGCRFKRTEDGDYEDGIAVTDTISGNILSVIDQSGYAVDKPYDAKLHHHIFNITLVW